MKRIFDEIQDNGYLELENDTEFKAYLKTVQDVNLHLDIYTTNHLKVTLTLVKYGEQHATIIKRYFDDKFDLKKLEKVLMEVCDE